MINIYLYGWYVMVNFVYIYILVQWYYMFMYNCVANLYEEKLIVHVLFFMFLEIHVL